MDGQDSNDTNHKMSLALAAAKMAVYARDLQTDIVTRIYVPSPDSMKPAFPGSQGAAEQIRRSVTFEESMASIHPDDRARIESLTNEAIRDGAEYELQYRYKLADDEYRWRQLNGRAYREENGESGNIFAITQDITERKKLECELRSRSAELAKASNQLAFALEAAGMAAFESFGKVSTLSSPALKKLVGLSPDSEDITVDRFLEIVHPDDRDIMRAKIGNARAAKIEDEFRIILPSGEVRWILTKGASSLDEENGPSAYIVVQDITTRKLAEEQLKRFSGVVAHDLKGPLSTIAMSADLVEQADTIEEARDYASFIKSGAHRLVGLIDDLLALARSGNGQPRAKENVPIQRVLTTVQANLKKSLLMRNTKLIIDSAPIETFGHEFQITQVFQNLIANALKFVKADQPVIKVRFQDRSEFWQIAVEDNGVGIDEAVRDRLFKPFERFHASQFEGTGLGLSIVKQVVENHGGRVWVESTVGKGSTFYFTLPKGARREAGLDK